VDDLDVDAFLREKARLTAEQRMLDVKRMPARITDSEFHRRNILLAIPNRQSLGFVPFARLQDELRCRTRTIFRQGWLWRVLNF
jgi:hypothetical protein